MEEIKLGDYVRTKQGYIAKVKNIDNEFMHCDNTVYISYGEESPVLPIDMELLDGTHLKAIDFIVKHSPNIIDLIEEGDYVNGIKVTGIMSGYVYLDKIDIETKKVKTLTDYQIKDIVTKEQINQVKYEV